MRRGLQVLLGAMGAVAVVAGTATVLTGASRVPGGGDVSPTIDSELRYYGAWYVLAGALMLRAVHRVEAERTLVRAVCLALLAGAGGRVISLAVAGRPHPLNLVLLALELALPALVLPWHAALVRRTG